MNCSELRRGLLAGAAPRTEEAVEHLAACADCRAMAEVVMGSAEAEVAAEPPLPEQVWAGLEQGLVQDRGLRGWLRARSPGFRWIGVALLATLAVVVRAASALRGDWAATYPKLELALLLTLWAGLWLWGTRLALRPLWLPEPDPAYRRLALAALTLSPVLAVAIAPDFTLHASLAEELWAAGLCWAVGAVWAFSVYAVLWAMERRRTVLPERAGLFAALGALVGNAMLQLHCPGRQAIHILCGHAALSLVLVPLCAAWAARSRVS